MANDSMTRNRHRDVVRALAFSLIVAPPAAWAVQRLSWALSPHRAGPQALPGLALAFSLYLNYMIKAARRVESTRPAPPQKKPEEKPELVAKS